MHDQVNLYIQKLCLLDPLGRHKILGDMSGLQRVGLTDWEKLSISVFAGILSEVGRGWVITLLQLSRNFDYE